MTLAIVREGDHVLLGMKKRGFGEGRWNGFGGKVGEGESVEEAMIRELREESGLEALAYKKAGFIEFFFPDGSEVEVHLFRVTAYDGDLCETEEMAPRWFLYHELPYENMWPDDKHWFPLFWEEKPFRGKFWFDKDTHIISQDLQETNSL